MINNQKPLRDIYTSTSKVSVISSYILVSLMMACVGAIFSQLASRIAPDLNLGFMAWVCFFVSLEVLITQQIIGNSLDSRMKWISRISEWVVLIILIKALLYLLNDPSRFLVDLPLLGTNFVETFFTGDFILAIFIVLAVWVISYTFFDNINRLHNLEEVTDWEQLSVQQMDLQNSHTQMSIRVFAIGTVLTIMAVLTRLVIKSNAWFISSENTSPVITVLIYFALSFILLSHARLALLRTRWWISKIKINPGLGRSWFTYAIIFFLFLGVLAFVLPTAYTMGLLETLGIVLKVFAAIFQLIAGAFAFIFGLLISLFGMDNKTPSGEKPQIIPTLELPKQVVMAPIPWLEMLKSILFWGILFIIIGGAIWQYLRQNRHIFGILKKYRLFAFLMEGFKKVWSWFAKTNRQLVKALAARVKQFSNRSRNDLRQILHGRAINWRNLTPRQQVILLYLKLIKIGNEKGVTRKKSQTPYQYEEALQQVVSEVDQDISGLTNEFIEARYSRHEIEPSDSDQAQSHWKRIISALKFTKVTKNPTKKP